MDTEIKNVIRRDQLLLGRRSGSINLNARDVDLLDNDDPLIDIQPHDSATSDHDDGLRLSEAEAARLLSSLGGATKILLERHDRFYTERRGARTRMQPPLRFARLRNFLGRVCRKFTGAKVMAATFLLQLICLVMLTLVDNLPREETSKRAALQAGSIGMIILQTANLIVIIILSGQLVAQVQSHKLSGTLLFQSYIASILLFAGIYTATYRLAVTSWKFVEDPADNKNPDMVVTTYTRFLFYSVSTATLCGAADALPKAWYTCIFASCQMLLSFMYFTSVIGTALTHRNVPTGKLPPLPEELTAMWRSKPEASQNDVGNMVHS